MDVAEISGRLTKARRSALLSHPSGEPTLELGLARANLIAAGLLDYRPRWLFFGRKVLALTLRGHLVRAHLLNQDTDHGK
jgi:hypothetical protein